MRAQDLLLSRAGGHWLLRRLLHDREQGPRRRRCVRLRTSRMQARRHTDAHPIFIKNRSVCVKLIGGAFGAPLLGTALAVFCDTPAMMEGSHRVSCPGSL